MRSIVKPLPFMVLWAVIFTGRLMTVSDIVIFPSSLN